MPALQTIPVSVSSYFHGLRSVFALGLEHHLRNFLSLPPAVIPERTRIRLYHIILLYALYTGLSAYNSVGQAILDAPLSDARFSFFAFAVASFSLLPASISFFLYAFFIAANICIFWITLNYIFFRNSEKNTNAVDSSFICSLPD